MSPERTNNVTPLPVRQDRSPRADQQQAPASDFFATLLDAHADRAAERAPSRRERQPSDDGPRDRRPVDRPARPDRPADVRDRSRPAERAAADSVSTDEPAPADKAAAAAAASAMLGLLAAVVPQQQPTSTAQAPAQAAPAAEEPTVAAQPVAQVPAVVPQPAPQGAPSEVAPTAPVVGVATVEGAETAGTEGDEPQAPAAPAVATVEAATTPDAGRASVAVSGNTQPGDRRSEGVSGGGAEARPSAEAPVNAQPTTQGQDAGSQQQSDQRQSDAPRTMQPAAPATAAPPTQRVDVTPVAVSGQAHVPAQSGDVRGAATLAQAPRAVGQLIHLASERGVQHARLNLKPVELGGIEIRLVASSAGVVAHVVADSPEAARLLQQAGDDLRRSLADSNVELLSLDVSTSDQERRDASAASDGFEQFGESGPRGRDGLGRSQHAGESGADLPISTDQGTVIELPDGVLVDVLA